MNLKEMFQHAIKKDQRAIVLLPIGGLETPETDTYVRVSVAQRYFKEPNFKNFLYLNLQVGTKFDKQADYLGAIRNDTDAFGPSELLKKDPKLLQTVIDLIKNPQEVLQTAGRKHSFCCFCGTQITSKDSLAVGYGPICAENFGLPWGI